MRQKYMMLTEVLLNGESQASCAKCFSKAKDFEVFARLEKGTHINEL